MHADIKEGFASLAKEREKLTGVLNEIGDIGTRRLKFWPMFNTSCVIAENYPSDVRKKLKLEMAANYLNDAKNEMQQYGIHDDDFLGVEAALQSVVRTIGTLVMKSYKSTVSDLREGEVSLGRSPSLNK